MPLYDARFAVGSKVRIGDAEALQTFKRVWAYHDKLQDEQLEHAGEVATVIKVGFYHGGDALYWLFKVPGVWHEPCLVGIPGQEAPADFSIIEFLNRQAEE